MNAQQWINSYPLSLLLLIPMYRLCDVRDQPAQWLGLLGRALSSRARPFCGESWGWQSARFRGWCSYNNCLTVGANPEGLYLAVMHAAVPAFSSGADDSVAGD